MQLFQLLVVKLEFKILKRDCQPILNLLVIFESQICYECLPSKKYLISRREYLAVHVPLSHLEDTAVSLMLCTKVCNRK